MNVVVDKTIAYAANNLLGEIQSFNLPVTINNSFRTTEEQEYLWDNRVNNKNPVARPGYSKHESGFAIDFNVKSLTEKETEIFHAIVKNNGFSPIEKDPPHFEADPLKHGYKSYNKAIEENQEDFKIKKGNVPQYRPDKKESKTPSLGERLKNWVKGIFENR